MSPLSEEVLQTLICSVCKKYLSVFPIKVFPNKQVKCGRCCEEDDGGTTSRLYELVAKQFHFPCINRFEGCKELLLAPEVKKHELSCKPDEYSCSLCNFSGSSYDLLYHIKLKHKESSLEDALFWIEKDQGSSSNTYFYCKNSIFVLVTYQYDANIQQLSLSLELLGQQHKSRQNIVHQFLLYSVQNKLQYKTGKIRNDQNDFERKNVMINLSEHKYQKNIIICKFQVWDLAVMLTKCMSDEFMFPAIMDKSASKALLKFKFEEVSKFKNDVLNFSVAKYWVADILWKLGIRKTKKDDTYYLSVFLCQEPYKQLIQSCNLIFTITLISFTVPHLHKSKSANKQKFKGSWGGKYIDWDEFIHPMSGYVTNDSAHFDVLIEVLPTEKIKCNGWDKLMVCSDCDE